MADVNKLALAQSVYADMCAALDRRDWNYKKIEEDLVITFTVRGDDFPMEFVIKIDEQRQLIRLFSKLPFTVPEEKRLDLAIATCVVSNKIMDGSFDYDIASGSIFFRMTASFMESKIGDGVFEYLVGCSSFTVDEYNDTLFAVSKGMISLEDFIAKYA